MPPPGLACSWNRHREREAQSRRPDFFLHQPIAHLGGKRFPWNSAVLANSWMFKDGQGLTGTLFRPRHESLPCRSAPGSNAASHRTRGICKFKHRKD